MRPAGVDTSRSEGRSRRTRAGTAARLGALAGSLALLTGPTYSSSAATVTHLPATTYTASTTWTVANSPYVLDGDVTVAAGATLTVEPGVVVKLNGQLRGITVNGVLKAVGTAANRITFTSYQDDSAGGDTNGDGAATSGALGQWSTIKVGSSNDQTELEFVDIRYGGYGFSNSGDTALKVEGSATVTVEDSTFTNNERSGISVGPGSSNPGVIVRRSTIRLNGNGVSANQGWMWIEERTLIEDNRADGVFFNLTSGYTGPASAILDSDVHRNAWRGVYLQVQSGLDLAKYPRGNRNNIYENADKQLWLLQAKRAADWKHNYWGEDIDFAYAASGCRDGGENSVGKLAYRSSQANPPAGPVDSGAYGISGPPFAICGYDLVEIGPNEFSPTYIGSLPRVPPGQALGPCSTPIFGKKPAACASDPVNTATGGFVDQRTDLTLPGIGVPFAFVRTYNSHDTKAGTLGPGWTHGYAAELLVKASGDVTLRGGDGQQVELLKQADGSYKGAPGVLGTLTKPGSTYEFLGYDQVKHTFDAAGRLTSIRNANSQGLVMAYDGNGLLTTIADSANRTITLTYTAGLLASVTVPDGRTVSYGYTGGRLTSVTDVTNKVWTYTYDSYGFLEKETDPLSHTVIRNVYARDGRVVEQYDALNNKTTFAWDPATQTATVTDPRNNVSRDTYASGVVTTQVDPAGNTMQLGHDVALNGTSVALPTGGTTTVTHDTRGNILTVTAPPSLGSASKSLAYNAKNDVTSVTDARGEVTTYGRDTAGNVTSITHDGETVATFAYNASGLRTTATDGRGNARTFTYDAVGNLTQETDALGGKTTYTYDSAGRLTSRVEPRGNVQGADPNDYRSSYTYDAAGRVLTETDPLGNVTTYAYDAVGNQTIATDANNRTTAYAYDAANRLVTVTAPNGGVTTITYDANGNLLTEKDPNNATTTYTYDANDRMASVTTPLGNKTTYACDANGNMTREVDPRGNVQGADPNEYATTYTYDAAGRMLTETDALGHTTTYTYDAVGNRTAVEDANDHTTTFAYDGANQLTAVVAPGGATTTYAYDAAGNVLSRTDAKNHVTTFAYDAENRLTTKTQPLSRQWTYAYDAAGNVTQAVDANGNDTQANGDGTTTFGYDRAGRLASIGYSDSTPDVAFAYDGVGNRTQMTDGSGAQTSSYDTVNRLTQVTRGADTFSYQYDLAGNLTRRTYPDATIVDYTYDAESRRTAVTTGGQAVTYGYDSAGNLTSSTLPAGNGYVEERTYDRAGRLVRVKNVKAGSVLSEFVRTLDAVGNPTQDVRTGSMAGTTTYTYDTRDRLTEVCFQASCPGGADPFVRWTYDAVGNRLSEARPGTTTGYTYNAADELTQAGSTSYTYDKNGNQTSAGSRTLTYGVANRVASTTSAGQTTAYAYDGDGNRVQTTTGAQITKLLWDVNHNLAQLALERDGAGALLRRYTYGAKRIAITSSGNASYYHYDPIGSVVNLTSASGGAQRTYAYEPFGVTRAETHDDPNAPENPMKFAGELADPTGLYYLRARQYDPVIGRFLGTDPVTSSASTPWTSAYAYVANRPTALVDPSGMFSEAPDSDVLEIATSAATAVPNASFTTAPDAVGGERARLIRQLHKVIRRKRLTFNHANDRRGLSGNGRIERMDGVSVVVNTKLIRAMVFLGQRFRLNALSVVGSHSMLTSSGHISTHWVGGGWDIDHINSNHVIRPGARAATIRLMRLMNRQVGTVLAPFELYCQGNGTYDPSVDALSMRDGRVQSGYTRREVGGHMDHVHISYR